MLYLDRTERNNKYNQLVDYLNWVVITNRDARGNWFKKGLYKINPFLEYKELVGKDRVHPDWVSDTLAEANFENSVALMMEVFDRLNRDVSLSLTTTNDEYVITFDKEGECVKYSKIDYTLSEALFDFSLQVIKMLKRENK